MSLHRIFVYGTLKRGKRNHHLLKDCQNGLARLLGSGKLAERYPLVLSSHGTPVLLDKKGSGMVCLPVFLCTFEYILYSLQQVEGELYEVDDQMLHRLDELEQHPELYTRSPTRCQLSDGTIEECETYIMHDFRDTVLEAPFLACYDPGQESGKSVQSLWDMKKKAISK